MFILAGQINVTYPDNYREATAQGVETLWTTMLKILTISTAIFLLCSCSPQKGRDETISKETHTDSLNIKSIDNTCEYKELSDALDFKVAIKKYKLPDSFDSCLINFSIVNKQSKKQIQTIQFVSTYFYENVFTDSNCCRSYTTGKNARKEDEDNDYGDVIVADFNFDNKEDIALKGNSGGNGGPEYKYYIQGSDCRFYIDNFLTDTMTYFPTHFNKNNKTITTLVHANARQLSETTYKLNIKTNSWEKYKHRFVE